MDFLTILLISLLATSVIANAVLAIMLLRLNQHQGAFESYVLDLYGIVNDYKQFVEELFRLSIHYYDDTIHEFMEKTKILKADLDDFMEQYSDLTPYVVPETKVEEPQEVLGLVRPDIYSREAKTE